MKREEDNGDAWERHEGYLTGLWSHVNRAELKIEMKAEMKAEVRKSNNDGEKRKKKRKLR